MLKIAQHAGKLFFTYPFPLALFWIENRFITLCFKNRFNSTARDFGG
jgi:hypothetical protein